MFFFLGVGLRELLVEKLRKSTLLSMEIRLIPGSQNITKTFEFEIGGLVVGILLTQHASISKGTRDGWEGQEHRDFSILVLCCGNNSLIWTFYICLGSTNNEETSLGQDLIRFTTYNDMHYFDKINNTM